MTKIRLGDTLRSIREKGKHVEHTFAGDKSTREIARSLIEETGLEVGVLDQIPADHQTTDFRASGKPIDELERLLSSIDGTKVIVDELKVKVERRSMPQKDGVRIVRSPKTGMIGVPERDEDNRLTVRMLFEPRARVGGEILIEGSEYVEATPYTIEGVRHEISNWTGAFTTEIDGVLPGTQAS